MSDPRLLLVREAMFHRERSQGGGRYLPLLLVAGTDNYTLLEAGSPEWHGVADLITAGASLRPEWMGLALDSLFVEDYGGDRPASLFDDPAASDAITYYCTSDDGEEFYLQHYSINDYGELKWSVPVMFPVPTEAQPIVGLRVASGKFDQTVMAHTTTKFLNERGHRVEWTMPR